MLGWHSQNAIPTFFLLKKEHMQFKSFTIKVTKPYRKEGLHMFHLNYTEVAFNIKEEFITHTEMRDDHTFIFHLTLPVSTHYCPSCSTATRQIKDYRQRQEIGRASCRERV